MKRTVFVLSGCEHTNLWADEYWECMARHYTVTIYHPAGQYRNCMARHYTVTIYHPVGQYLECNAIFLQKYLCEIATNSKGAFISYLSSKTSLTFPIR